MTDEHTKDYYEGWRACRDEMAERKWALKLSQEVSGALPPDAVIARAEKYLAFTKEQA